MDILFSFILGALGWAVVTAMFFSAMLVGGVLPIQTESWWFEVLFVSVIFLGLPGWILAYVGWRKTRVERSGLGLSVGGGAIMSLTGIMLLPGVLAIIGGVFSRRTHATEPTAAEIGEQW